MVFCASPVLCVTLGLPITSNFCQVSWQLTRMLKVYLTWKFDILLVKTLRRVPRSFATNVPLCFTLPLYNSSLVIFICGKQLNNGGLIWSYNGSQNIWDFRENPWNFETTSDLLSSIRSLRMEEFERASFNVDLRLWTFVS